MKYRKLPVIIEAEVYRRGLEDGFDCWLINGDFIGTYGNSGALPKANCKPFIDTLEGKHYISEGDYIITGVKGERYPCKPEIFHMTYEAVEEQL